MMENVLKDNVEHWDRQVSESKDNVGASAEKAQSAMKLVEESASNIGNQEEEVKVCKGSVDENVQGVKATEEALKCASKEVAEFDQNLLAITAEKDELTSVYNGHFTSLKNGGLDTKEVTSRTKEVVASLKKLSAEPSLLSAITPAFKKSPADRGPFDVMATEGAENLITAHLGKLQEQIDKADEIKAEKVSTEAAKQEELKAAMEKRTSSEDALKAAEEGLAGMEAKHLDLLKDANAAAEESNASENVVAAKESTHKAAQFALSTFTELFERKSVVPEPIVEPMAVEEKLEVCESNPTELATVA
jgi:chromosome segregation ATPase